LLADAASAWRARLRAGDILARYGGDEFVLLLPATSPAEAGEVLKRLHGGELPVSWSIGFGEWGAGEALETALTRADRDLYSIKRALARADASTTIYRAGSLLPST
jgi:diguanylate cyclase (GGDEF)-like protein